MGRLNYSVDPKEGLYFSFKVLFGIIGYAVICLLIAKVVSSDLYVAFIPFLLYIPLLLFLLLFRMGLLVGYLRGNSVKVTAKQFSDIHDILLKQCERLEIRKAPEMFILQSGGLLNAFATRFLGSNYIVIYSDILEEAYDSGYDSVEFIIGHELGHIKRKHMVKSLFLFPSLIIPFLNRAYSRACEYTCDNIGANLNPAGSLSGLLILASGKKLWEKVDSEQFMAQEKTERGFWSWFAEKISTHPKITKRLIRLKKQNIIDYTMKKEEAPKLKDYASDHSSYMPKFG